MIPIAQSTLMDTHSLNIHLNSHKLPTTQAMVEEAILTLNTTRGFSLQRLKKYIVEKYYIELTARRYNLIKDYLRAQLAHGTIANVSGKGLSGSFRLLKKRKTTTASASKEQNATDKQRRVGNDGGGSVNEPSVARKRKKGVEKAKRDKSKKVTSKSGNQTVAPATLAETPPNIATLSTEPNAPYRNSSTLVLSHVEQAEATPRSAGSRVARKRKLMPPPEPIMGSQEF